MGGRGSGSRMAGGGQGSAPALNPDLVRRANDASVIFDAGDATVRQYNSNVDEIRGMDLTDAEKTGAIKDLHSLTEKQLQAEGEARSPYAGGMGPARFNQRQVSRNADKAAQARQNTQNFMDNLRKDQKQKAKQREARELKSALDKAIVEGALEFTHNGKTWTRKSRRSKTFTAR